MIIAVDMFTEAMDEEKEGNGCHSRLQRTGLATLPGQGVGQARGRGVQAMSSYIAVQCRGRRRQSRPTFWEMEEQRTRLAETSRAGRRCRGLRRVQGPPIPVRLT